MMVVLMEWLRTQGFEVVEYRVVTSENLDEAMEKIVEWSKVWLAGGDVRVCMDKQIDEFLNV